MSAMKFTIIESALLILATIFLALAVEVHVAFVLPLIACCVASIWLPVNVFAQPPGGWR